MNQLTSKRNAIMAEMTLIKIRVLRNVTSIKRANEPHKEQKLNGRTLCTDGLSGRK